MSSGSDLSDSSDSETEDKLNKEISDLEAALLESPYYYDGYMQIIRLLRQQGDLDRARKARHEMRKVFPLAEDIWLEWIKDELPLTGLFADSALEMRQLFESAVTDYLSVKLWLEYARFAIDKMSVMEEGLGFPREIFEQALVECSQHVSQSGEIWEAYLEFEKTILQSLQELQMNDPDNEELKAQTESQFQRIDKLYKRRLSVPHVGMEDAFLEYKNSFSEVSVSEESLPGYVAAKKKMYEYLPFETKLSSTNPPSLESYHGYLSHLTSTKADPALINTLYRRAVAHHCLDPQLWKEYLHFLDKNFSKAGAVLLPGYKLSVRNLPWCVELWLGLVKGMERNKSTHTEILAVFERSLVDTFSSGSDYLKMWTAYCDYYRRLVTMDTTQEQHSHEDLLELFKRARNKLKEDFGNSGDPKDALGRYHANMERSVEGGCVIWDDIMTRHGNQAQYWLDYISYIRQRGEPENCRRVFNQAVNSVTDDVERMCEEYVQFEREEGTLDSYDATLVRIASQMDRVRERQEKAAEKEALKKEENKKKRNKTEKTQLLNQDQGGARGRRGHSGETRRNREREGRGQESNQRKRSAMHTFFKDSDEEAEMVQRRKKPRVADEGDDIGASKRNSGGSGQDSSFDDVAMDTGDTVKQYPDPMEERTVFISNLPDDVTEDDLKAKFVECGEIAEVRLIHSRKTSHTNVFAYLEFTSPSPVSKALLLDRSKFMDKYIYVSPFRSKGDVPAATIKRTERMNKLTVFVGNLQRDIKEKVLDDLFKQCGEIREVRIPRNSAGRPRGCAYVEYTDESSALQAVEKLDSHLIGLKRISVALSNPPAKKPADDATSQGSGKEGVAEGGVSGVDVIRNTKGVFAKPSFIPRRAKPQADEEDLPMERRSRTNISLLPRVLSHKGGASVSKSEGGGGGGGGKMSNDDFKNLFAATKK